MTCTSLALAVLINCTSATALPVGAASDAIPDSTPPAWSSAFDQTFVQPQPGRWDPSRFDSATAVGVKALLDSATVHGIPYGAVYNYALQGAANRRSGQDIIKKTRIYFIAMVDARAALGDYSTESELAAGADLIRAGMDGKALQGIRSARPSTGSAVTALMVAGDLIIKTIPVNQARDAVTALARASKSDEGLNAAQALVARNAQRGPGMARDALDRYVKSNAGGAQKNAPGKQVTRPPGPPDA
ncbi:MAG: hypothetical protein ABJB74_19570 [Gemmatimonas sp.]